MVVKLRDRLTKLYPLEVTSINKFMTSNVDSSGDSTKEFDPPCSQANAEQPSVWSMRKAAARACE